MKKVIAMFVIAALTACGSASTEATNAPIDTTSLGRDTTTKSGGGVQEPSTEGKAEAQERIEIK
jgi:hypothetical protein